MPKVKKAAKAKAKPIRYTCSLCHAVTLNGKNLCTLCANNVSKKSGPNADNFDRVLIRLLLNSKANLRLSLVKNLASNIKTGLDP